MNCNFSVVFAIWKEQKWIELPFFPCVFLSLVVGLFDFLLVHDGKMEVGNFFIANFCVFSILNLLRLEIFDGLIFWVSFFNNGFVSMHFMHLCIGVLVLFCMHYLPYYCVLCCFVFNVVQGLIWIKVVGFGAVYARIGFWCTHYKALTWLESAFSTWHNDRY